MRIAAPVLASLLQSGPVYASRLAKDTRLNRTTTYSVLKELMAVGNQPAHGLRAWENYLTALQDEQSRRAASLCPKYPQVA